MRKMLTNTQDLAALACKAEQSWGVYCSWPGWSVTVDFESPREREKRIRGCLPEHWYLFADQYSPDMLPPECMFLRLFDNETSARHFYRQCRGESAGMPYGGVYAALIRPNGEFATINT